jgi:sporulation protein YlmC with PRC-barrel domain
VTAPGVLRLSELLGAPVAAADETPLGRVQDLAVTLDDDYPAVHQVLVRERRGAPPRAVPMRAVARLAPVGVTLATGAAPAGAADEAALRLGRDVLDVQVVDARARRLARVGEVVLAWDEDVLRLVAVDVGWRAILRRLGLPRLADRASRDALDWAGLHVAGPAGHAIQLSSAGAAVHRLDPAQLAELLARLPSDRGAQVLDTVEGSRAAAALAAAHPDLAADLIGALREDRALALVGLLDDDDAAAALRGAGAERRAALLGGLPAARAERLRATLAAAAPAPEGPRPARRWWAVLRGHEGRNR